MYGSFSSITEWTKKGKRKSTQEVYGENEHHASSSSSSGEEESSLLYDLGQMGFLPPSPASSEEEDTFSFSTYLGEDPSNIIYSPSYNKCMASGSSTTNDKSNRVREAVQRKQKTRDDIRVLFEFAREKKMWATLEYAIKCLEESKIDVDQDIKKLFKQFLNNADISLRNMASLLELEAELFRTIDDHPLLRTYLETTPTLSFQLMVKLIDHEVKKFRKAESSINYQTSANKIGRLRVICALISIEGEKVDITIGAGSNRGKVGKFEYLKEAMKLLGNSPNMVAAVEALKRKLVDDSEADQICNATENQSTFNLR